MLKAARAEQPAHHAAMISSVYEVEGPAPDFDRAQ